MSCAIQDQMHRAVDSLLMSQGKEAWKAANFTTKPIQKLFGSCTGWMRSWMVPTCSTVPALNFGQSLINRVQGWAFDCRFSEGKQRVAQAWRVGDYKGVASGAAKLAGTTADQVFTYSRVADQGLKWYHHVQGVTPGSVTHTLSQVFKAIRHVEVGVGAVFGAYGLVTSVQDLYRTYRLERRLERAGSRGFSALMGETILDAGQLWKKIRGSKREREGLVKKALFSLTQQGTLTCTQWRDYLQDKAVNDSSLALYAKKLKLPLETLSELSRGELIGLFLLVQEQETAVDALTDARASSDLSRLTTRSCTAKIKKAFQRGLQQRLSSGQESVRVKAEKEYTALLGEVKTQLRWNALKKTALFVMSAATFVGSILEALTLFGLCAVSLAFPWWLMTLLVAALLLYAAWEVKGALMDGPAGTADHFALKLMITLYAIAFVASVICIPLLSLPLLELCKVSGIFGLGLGINVGTLIAVNRKQRKWKEQHPDLPALLKEMQELPYPKEGPVRKEMWQQIKALPKKDRQMLRLLCRNLLSCEPGLEDGRALTNLIAASVADYEANERLELYKTGIKKALKRCWQDHHVEDTPVSLQRALALQALFDALEDLPDEPQPQDSANVARLFEEATRDPQSRAYLQGETSYVLTRMRSTQELQRALEVIAHAKLGGG